MATAVGTSSIVNSATVHWLQLHPVTRLPVDSELEARMTATLERAQGVHTVLTAASIVDQALIDVLTVPLVTG